MLIHIIKHYDGVTEDYTLYRSLSHFKLKNPHLVNHVEEMLDAGWNGWDVFHILQPIKTASYFSFKRGKICSFLLKTFWRNNKSYMLAIYRAGLSLLFLSLFFWCIWLIVSQAVRLVEHGFALSAYSHPGEGEKVCSLEETLNTNMRGFSASLL